MAAQKNNRFWELRSKHGRDKLFATPELMWQAACEYFEWCEGHPITDPRSYSQRKIQRPYNLLGLCNYLGCNSAYFRNFKSNLKPEDQAFAVVIGMIEDVIFRQQLENATIGVYKENIVARALGMADKNDLGIDFTKLSDAELDKIINRLITKNEQQI